MIRVVRVDRRELLAILAGGFVGALARAELGVAITDPVGSWPWATLLVNVAGAIVLGFVAARWASGEVPRALLGTGFCGALTTFSTMQVELLQMFDRGRVGLAVVYATVSVVAGVIGVCLAGTSK
jgi:fluoride exporter